MTMPLIEERWEPIFGAVYVPTLPSTVLTEDERATISRLQLRAWRDRRLMLLTDAYYRGEQILTSLGIALPPELEGLRVVLGWPAMAVDPYVERIWLDCFRLPSADSADATLTDVWSANGMDGELSLVVLDALVKRCGYITVGSGDDPANDPPRICAESPLNISVEYDLRGQPENALQTYWLNGLRHAALLTPNETVHIAEDLNRVWQLVDRDVHNFGAVPLVRVANRPETNIRDGRSEITFQLMSIVDAASRTLLNLTAAGEFYSVPQKLILGVSEADFQSPDGTPRTAWQTYLSHVLTLDRDEEGDLPQVHQFEAYDPSVFTKVLEMYAGQAAGIVAALPQDMGLYTQGNPVSAEALQVAEARRDRRARRMISNFTHPVAEAGKYVMRFLNGGDLPAGYEKLTADWRDPEILNFTGMSDGIAKLTQMGTLPARSDVLRKKLGFTAVQRRQMAREDDAADEFVREVGSSIEGKEIRSAAALAKAAENAAGPPVAAPAPAPNA